MIVQFECNNITNGSIKSHYIKHMAIPLRRILSDKIPIGTHTSTGLSFGISRTDNESAYLNLIGCILLTINGDIPHQIICI